MVSYKIVIFFVLILPLGLLAQNDTIKLLGTINVNNAYVLPSDSGDSLQVLSSNGHGQLNWISIEDSCPSGMIPISSKLCIDSLSNSAVTFYVALQDCMNKGERLPSYQEVYHATNLAGLPASSSWLWTSDLYFHNGSTRASVIVRTNDLNNYSWSSLTSSREFRCISEK